MNSAPVIQKPTPRLAAPKRPTLTSEGTQSAVRVLRLCNSRHAHVALVPMPWRPQ